MSVEMCLNELSLENWNGDCCVAKKIIDDFVETSIALTRSGTQKVLLSSGGTASKKLLGNYTLANWFADSRNDRDKVRFLKSILSKKPYFEDLNLNNAQMKHAGNDAVGLLYSYLYGHIAVSFLSNTTWDTPRVIADLYKMDDNSDLSESKETIRHTSKIEHINEHKAYIEAQSSSLQINVGIEIFDHLQTVCPDIIFCANAQKQLRGFSGNEPYFKKIVEFFLSLACYINESWENQFDYKQIPFDISPETKATLDKYPEERTFTCPDKQKRLFTLHAKINPFARRIYFFPISKQVIVGYIGEHLKTSKG